jgi:hypothetical protein
MFNWGKKPPQEKPKTKVNFIYFHTACGCYKMVPASPQWRPTPYITVPLEVPTQVLDWVSNTELDLSSTQPIRKFRLDAEEWLQDGETRMFTYREIM